MPSNGLEVVRLPGALAIFADAGSSPVGASEADLAALAIRAVGTLCQRPVALLYAFQIHSALTFLYQAAGPLDAEAHLVGDCDGLITAEPWTALQVRNADCLPVALAGGGAVAMLHAGWRGLAGDVLGRAVARLEGELGVPPDELRAVIGVGVGPCHYPVGSDVLQGLGRWPLSGSSWHHEDRVDLASFAAGRLRHLGVQAEAIRVLPGCTACQQRWHSYRRDGERAGRQWSALVLTPDLPTLA
jgi:YfiH family protein